MAAHSAAAGTDRDAYADVAAAANGGGLEPRVPSESGHESEIIPDLPPDAAGFVVIVHSRVDLFGVSERLLNSTDDKIAQRELERLLEMVYGRGGGSRDDAPVIISDLPGPDRSRGDEEYQ
jgi:hypothetical protein